MTISDKGSILSVDDLETELKEMDDMENPQSAGAKLCISVAEMGKRIGVSRKTAFDLANSQGFPAIRVGHRILIPIKGLETWIEDHTGIAG